MRLRIPKSAPRPIPVRIPANVHPVPPALPYCGLTSRESTTRSYAPGARSATNARTTSSQAAARSGPNRRAATALPVGLRRWQQRHSASARPPKTRFARMPPARHRRPPDGLERPMRRHRHWRGEWRTLLNPTATIPNSASLSRAPPSGIAELALVRRELVPPALLPDLLAPTCPPPRARRRVAPPPAWSGPTRPAASSRCDNPRTTLQDLQRILSRHDERTRQYRRP